MVKHAKMRGDQIPGDQTGNLGKKVDCWVWLDQSARFGSGHSGGFARKFRHSFRVFGKRALECSVTYRRPEPPVTPVPSLYAQRRFGASSISSQHL